MHNRTFAAEYVHNSPIHSIRQLHVLTGFFSVGSATPSLPASALRSLPRPRLSVSRLLTLRAVSRLMLKCKLGVVFFSLLSYGVLFSISGSYHENTKWSGLGHQKFMVHGDNASSVISHAGVGRVNSL
jgi:hypothetical protein